jgi:hypothetical protein
MKAINRFNRVLVVLAALPWAVCAQDTAGIQRKLESEYKLTKTTDDKSDIVTAGSVLLLHVDKILMVAASSSANPCMNTYKDGKISPTKVCGAGENVRKHMIGPLKTLTHSDSAPATRNFVSGEKFWLTKVDVRSSGIVLDFFTDATPSGDQGIRYKGALTIPFGAVTPTPDQALKAVAEVITVVPPEEDAKKGGDKGQAAPEGGQQDAAANQPAAPAPAQPATPPPAAPAPEPAAATIEPPPPPPADPPEIKEGQTIDEVVAALGQPQHMATVGAKKIYYYKDLKVTFVNGKVKDVQ